MYQNISLGLLGLGFCGLLYANPYWVEPDKRVDAIISLNQLTRIKVLDDRITQVFGDENTFSLETDTENGQIFIKPKDDNRLFLTLITENHNSIDLALEPVEMDAQTLVLKTMQSQPTPPPTEPLAKEIAPQIIRLITSMNKNVLIEGFTRLTATKQMDLEPFTLNLQSIYQGDDMSGEIWTVKNTSRKTQHLTEQSFATEPSVLAVALKTRILAPKAITTLFKVKTHE